MENPYFELHRRFRQAGADVLLSSGQACVAFGVAAFSKDGDWVIRENQASCRAVLAVLADAGAVYRLGAPLDPQWLAMGLTGHFEYQSGEGTRIRVDLCSRPPRVPDIDGLWAAAVRADGLDIVDVESLLRLKHTRRLRDYPIIGALAEVAGLEQGVARIALEYLQDYQLLADAVLRWPREAEQAERAAVRRLVAGAPRRDVVIALAIEQDERIQADEERIRVMQATAGDFPKRFSALRSLWRRAATTLLRQHEELKELAQCLLQPK